LDLIRAHATNAECISEKTQRSLTYAKLCQQYREFYALVQDHAGQLRTSLYDEYRIENAAVAAEVLAKVEQLMDNAILVDKPIGGQLQQQQPQYQSPPEQQHKPGTGLGRITNLLDGDNAMVRGASDSTTASSSKDLPLMGRRASEPLQQFDMNRSVMQAPHLHLPGVPQHDMSTADNEEAQVQHFGGMLIDALKRVAQESELVAGMTNSIAEMTHQQQAEFDSIEHSLEAGQANVQRGRDELEYAWNKRRTRRMQCLAMTACCVLMPWVMYHVF